MKHKLRRLMLLLGAVATLSSAGAQEYIIGVNDSYKRVVNIERINALFEAMYAPLGIKPTARFYPSLRGLRLANAGELDAEAGRVLAVAERYENLMVVPEPLIRHDVLLYCLNKDTCSLKPEGRYGLISGLQAGIPYCAKNGLACLSNQSQAFLKNAFAGSAIDGLIGSHATSYSVICDRQTVYYRKLLDLELVSHHLVHKKHADKVAALSQSIKSMREAGYFDAFVESNSRKPDNCHVKLVALSV